MEKHMEDETYVDKLLAGIARESEEEEEGWRRLAKEWKEVLGNVSTRDELQTLICARNTWSGLPLNPLVKAQIELRVGGRRMQDDDASVVESESDNELKAEEMGMLTFITDMKASTLGMEDEDLNYSQEFQVSEKYRKIHVLEEYRIKAVKSSIYKAWEVFQLGVVLFACGIYVWSTYEDPIPLSIIIINYMCASLFVMDFVIHFILADSKLRFLVSWHAIVDYITIPPYFITPTYYGVNLSFFQALRALRIIRIVTIINQGTFSRFGLSPLQEKVMVLMAAAFCVIFCTTGIMVELESLNFHTSIYFTVVSITTLGYGDISPATFWGRWYIVFLMLFLLIVVPIQSQELLTLYSQYDAYGGKMRRGFFYKRNHVVVTGHINTNNLGVFLEEFFHSDRGASTYKVAVLLQEQPDSSLLQYLRKYRKLVYFFTGSPMLPSDLKRLRVRKCRGVFVLADVASETPQDHDKSNIIVSLSVRKHAQSVPTFLQLIRPEFRSIAWKLTKTTHTICLDRLKLGILARSAFVPGLTTLFGNLVRSSSIRIKKKMPLWLREYLMGENMEIYQVKIPQIFHGVTFACFSEIIFSEFRCTAIGIYEDFSMDGDAATVIIPEVHRMLQTNDLLFIIADSDADIRKIRRFGREKNIYKSNRRRRLLQHWAGMGAPLTNSTLTTLHSNTNFIIAKSDRISYSRAIRKHTKGLVDHIIVCGPETSLSYIIAPLRFTDPTADIVIFYPKLPDQSIWKKLSKYPNIHMVQGSPLRKKDLVSVNVETAKLMIVTRGANFAEDLGLNADTDSILSYLNIREHFPSVDLRVEILEPPTLELLRPVVFSKKKWRKPRMMPAYAAGQVFENSSALHLLIQSYFNPNMISMVNNIITIPTHGNELSKVLELIPVPSEFEQQTYYDLFHHFLWQRGTVIIGLYRMNEPDESDEWSGVETDVIPFVFTSPPGDSILYPGDRVYVFARCT